MGKRKSTVVVKKTTFKPKMESSFPCPFCNQETAVECRLDRSRQIGSATCRQCSAGYQTVINYLTEAIDVYGEWVDAIEAQEQKKRKLNEKTQEVKREEPIYEKRHYGGEEYEEGEDLPELPFNRRQDKKEDDDAKEAEEESEAESEAEFTDSDNENDSDNEISNSNSNSE